MLLKEFTLFASTYAFIPLMNIPPIVAVPWAIANSGIALLFLEDDLSCAVLSLDVASLLNRLSFCQLEVPVK